MPLDVSCLFSTDALLASAGCTSNRPDCRCTGASVEWSAEARTASSAQTVSCFGVRTEVELKLSFGSATFCLSSLACPFRLLLQTPQVQLTLCCFIPHRDLTINPSDMLACRGRASACHIQRTDAAEIETTGRAVRLATPWMILANCARRETCACELR